MSGRIRPMVRFMIRPALFVGRKTAVKRHLVKTEFGNIEIITTVLVAENNWAVVKADDREDVVAAIRLLEQTFGIDNRPDHWWCGTGIANQERKDG